MTLVQQPIDPVVLEAMIRMPSGIDLDVLVADLLMGWVHYRSSRGHWVVVDPEDEDRGLEPMYGLARYDGQTGALLDPPWWEGVDIPAYSRDITDAWRVVRRMAAHAPYRFQSLQLIANTYSSQRTYATFDRQAFRDYDPYTWAEGVGEDAAPLAICRAALMTLRYQHG